MDPRDEVTTRYGDRYLEHQSKLGHDYARRLAAMQFLIRACTAEIDDPEPRTGDEIPQDEPNWLERL